jgi:hypothetical protein
MVAVDTVPPLNNPGVPNNITVPSGAADQPACRAFSMAVRQRKNRE